MYQIRGQEIFCKYCNNKCVKDGLQCNGTQRYKCKNCHRKQQQTYTYQAYNSDINQSIVTLTKEGVGIRSTARILKISTTTLLKRIVIIAQQISEPTLSANNTYEVDEIKSFLGRKKDYIWIAYALNREDKKVASFAVGARTNQTLNNVLNKLSDAKKIYTDRLRQYKSLIHQSIHRTSLYGTNRIERHNLTIRTHIKRLARRTICYSRSMMILFSVMKIYFWG